MPVTSGCATLACWNQSEVPVPGEICISLISRLTCGLHVFFNLASAPKDCWSHSVVLVANKRSQANHKMLPPESQFKKYWNLIITLLVMYNTLFIIIVICFNRFDPNTGYYWYDRSTAQVNFAPMIVDYLVDVVFFVDIYLTFRTTFFDAENELVLDRRVIAKHYLRHWFFVRCSMKPNPYYACSQS